MFSDSFANIQTEIQYNVNFFNTCTTISNLLSTIDTENTSIQAGQKTVYDDMPGYLNDLLLNVNLALSTFLTIFLTSDQQTDYDTGDFTLDETLSINLISFYNSLQKLKISAAGGLGIIRATLKTNTIRYFANADDYRLTTDQFETDYEFNNRIQDQSSFEYYTVQDGDTARILALRVLKDSEKYLSILQLNNITESNFIDGDLIGQKIKIPIPYSGPQRDDNNLIYDSNDEDVFAFLHGKDFALDINRKLKIDPKGDLLALSGVENTYDAMLNKLNNKKGSLNVFSPNWGLTPLGDGNSPLLVKIDRYITDLISQIKSDPRVTSVNIDTTNLIINGESLSVSGTIKFLGNDEDNRGFEVNV